MYENFYKYEIEQTILVQDKFMYWENFLAWISEILHPCTIIIYVIPFLSIFNTKLHARVLITAALSEYLNLMIKWIVGAYRPYTWVPETKLYSNLTRPYLRQTKLTCESTSGFPSGHLMFTSAVFCVTCAWSANALSTKFKSSKCSQILINLIIWSAYSLILVFLTVSRMYFGCHFLHQCITGLFLGICCAFAINTNKAIRWITTQTRKKFGIYTTLLIVIVFGIYWIQKFRQIDPQSAVKLAFKWCENPLFVKPTSTPMFGVSRDIGIFFGVMFASPLNERFDKKLSYKSATVLWIILLIAQKLFFWYTPKQNGYIIYYSYTCFVYGLFAYLFLVFIPKYCKQQPSKIKKT